MRLLITALAAAVALSISAVALAATTTRDEVKGTTGGTPNLASGGKLAMAVTHKKGASRFHVTINLNATVRSPTVLGFAAHPCRSTSCSGASTSTIRLGTGARRITFNGNVRVVRRAETGPSSRVACIYAQVRDLGPRGRGKGTIVRRASGGKGVVKCMKVGAAEG